MAIDVPDADAMRALGRRLAAVLRPGDLVVLSGDLGAGKTTMVQGLAGALGVRGPVTSPTFVIARIHPALVPGRPALVHVDAYRLGSLEEVDDLDLDTSLGNSVTVVEWGEGKVEALADDRLEVVIRRGNDTVSNSGPDIGSDIGSDIGPNGTRRVTLRAIGARWDGAAL